ncbi:uncharacterized protein [Hyperolius riggenbachi]|uniref:uncharacterized protein n=1 Tax=Hyperolius riggenbachi TaxID=752182 RepID=UPI0035A307D9
MDKTWKHHTKKILDFTLEIISLLTGERLLPVKSGDHVTITVPPDHYVIPERHNKILEITVKMMKLLMGEAEEVMEMSVEVKEEPEETCFGGDWQRAEEGERMRTIKQEEFPTEISPAHVDEARIPSDGWLALPEHCKIKEEDIEVYSPIGNLVTPNILSDQNSVERPEVPSNKEVTPCYINTTPGHLVTQGPPNPKESTIYKSLNATSNNQLGHHIVGRPPGPTIPMEPSYTFLNVTSHGQPGNPPVLIPTAPSNSRASSPCIILLMPPNIRQAAPSNPKTSSPHIPLTIIPKSHNIMNMPPGPSNPKTSSLHIPRTIIPKSHNNVVMPPAPSNPETSSPQIPLTIIPKSHNIINMPPSSSNPQALSTNMSLSVTSNIHPGHGIVDKTASPSNPKILSSHVSFPVSPNTVNMDKLPGPSNTETSSTPISIAITSNIHPGACSAEKPSAPLNSEKQSSQSFLLITPNVHPGQPNLGRPPASSNPEASGHQQSFPVTPDNQQGPQLSDILSKPKVSSPCISLTVPPNIHSGHSNLDTPPASLNPEALSPFISLITSNNQSGNQIPDGASTFSNPEVSSTCTSPSVTPDLLPENFIVNWPTSHPNPEQFSPDRSLTVTPNYSLMLYSADRTPESPKPSESPVIFPTDAKYCCPECDKCFRTKSGLHAHIRSHTGEKPFSCSECGKLFKHKSHLTAHVRLHTGEGLLVCPECGRTYLFKSQLAEHLMIHTGQKPHPCHVCGLHFTFLRDLRRHITKCGSVSTSVSSAPSQV